MIKLSKTQVILILSLSVSLFQPGCGEQSSRIYQKGLKFARQQKYEQAIVEIRRLLQIDPRSSKARNALGQLYRSRNLYNQAIEELARAVELDEKDPVPAYNLGCLYRELEDWPRALQYYREAVERDPGFSPALYRLGAAYSDLGQPGKARTYFEEFLKTEPARPAPGYNNLGVLLWKEGEGERSREEFKKALRLEPGLPEALFNFGVSSLARGEERPAGVKALLKYLKLRPRPPGEAAVKKLLKQAGGVSAAEEGIYSSKEYLERGEQYEEAGQYRQAVQQYLRALELDSACSSAHYRLGLLYDIFLSDKLKAVEHYEKFLEANPKSSLAGEALTRLAEARSQVGEVVLAKGDLGTPLAPESAPPPRRPKASPTPRPNAGDYYREARELEKAGDLARALSAYEEAVKLDPEFAPAHLQSGLVYLSQGRYEHAVTSLRRARELDPSLPVRESLGSACLKLGEAALSAGRYEPALEHFQEAREEGKEDAAKRGRWEAHRAFARKLQDEDDYAAAASHLASCLQIRPDEADMCLALGDIYAWKLNRPDRARPCYENFLRLSPRHGEAARVKKLLEIGPEKAGPETGRVRQAAASGSAGDHYNRGAACHRKGDVASAEKEYKTALDLDPGLYQACYNLGVIYNQTGRSSEALAAYKEAVRLKPDFARAHLALFNLYYHHFKIKNLARRHGREYVRLEPDSSQSRLIAEWLGE